jgi:hypothetical protein
MAKRIDLQQPRRPAYAFRVMIPKTGSVSSSGANRFCLLH